jgi:hypothetical protein
MGTEVEKLSNMTKYEDYDSEFGWKKLYIKFAFEDMLCRFSDICDFKVLYKYINAMGDYLDCLVLPILDKTKFKSNNYWIMALIGRLNKVKSLKIMKNPQVYFGGDGFKFM